MKGRGKIVGGFALIVLGVLAALMVDTWVQDRRDSDLEQEYLARLIDDLDANHRALEREIAFYTDVRRFGLETLE